MPPAPHRLLVDFKDLEVLRSGSLEAFCATYSPELGEAARIAARASLRQPLILNYIGESLRFTNGLALGTLWKYHRACSPTAIKTIEGRNLRWFTRAQTTWWRSTPAGCYCTKHQFRVGPGQASWPVESTWIGHLDRALNALREQPCGVGMKVIHHYLGEEVEKLVLEVRGTLSLLDTFANFDFRRGSFWNFLFDPENQAAITWISGRFLNLNPICYPKMFVCYGKTWN